MSPSQQVKRLLVLLSRDPIHKIYSSCKHSTLVSGTNIKSSNSLFFFLAALGLRGCCARLSLVAASGAYSSLWCVGFSLRWPLLLQSTGSRRTGSLVVSRRL